MRRTSHLLRLSAAFAAMLALLGLGRATASADNNATVTITDSGFNPSTLTITVGSTVFFTNAGSRVHTATTRQIGGVTPFDTGGIGPNQTVSINFTLAGAYPYTSAVDCLNLGAPPTGFDCGTTATIVVNYGGGEPQVGNLTPVPTSTPTPVLTGPPQSALVHITSKGFDPPTVTIALGGSVTFENDDNSGVHNAITYGGGNPQPFDTGGLGPGLSASLTFSMQGTYTYTSAIDCLNSKTPGFNCGAYQVNVSGQQSGVAPGPGATAVPVVTGQTTVSIDDVSGFNPPVLAIHPGQTVTWTNTGSQVHSVVSNPGYYNQFDSGGLANGQTFSFTFQNPGSFGYHSSTEPSYALDGMGNQVVSYKYNGTILVQ
jgi:plastocyanin